MRTFLIVAALTWVGAVSAHAELVNASLVQGETVAAAPREVTLTFSEPVEARFGLFKVYPLGTDVDLSGGNAEQRLNGLAGQLVATALEARGDESARADTGVATADRASAEVVMSLKGELTPGPYVVMWRVVSADTHPVEGFSTFIYAPND